MAKFEKGKPRLPNAGRKKGSTNKKTLEFSKMLEESGFDPGMAYVQLFNDLYSIYKYYKRKKLPHMAAATLEKAGTVLNNICQFQYPRKKAIEHSGEVGVKTFADFMAAAAEKKKQNGN